MFVFEVVDAVVESFVEVVGVEVEVEVEIEVVELVIVEDELLQKYKMVIQKIQQMGKKKGSSFDLNEMTKMK